MGSNPIDVAADFFLIIECLYLCGNAFWPRWINFAIILFIEFQISLETIMKAPPGDFEQLTSLQHIRLARNKVCTLNRNSGTGSIFVCFDLCPELPKRHKIAFRSVKKGLTTVQEYMMKRGNYCARAQKFRKMVTFSDLKTKTSIFLLGTSKCMGDLKFQLGGLSSDAGLKDKCFGAAKTSLYQVIVCVYFKKYT